MFHQPKTTVIVAMPWSALYTPSIQIGMLTAVLEHERLPVTPLSFYLDFAELLSARTRGLDEAERITTRDYLNISERLAEVALGDWIFVTSDFDPEIESKIPDYLEYLRVSKIPERYITKALAMRRFVPEFIERCAREVIALDPLLVGFTSTFSQNVPSIVLAQRIKALAPHIPTVCGGANFEGPMGKALHRAFPAIDIVLQGEAELSFPALVRAMANGEPYDHVSGLIFRRDGEQVVTDRVAGDVVPMSAVRSPLYDEYFERLRPLAIRNEVDPMINMPVESSRGCWWGQKSHCTFCGLNGTTMAFRSKDPAVFTQEVMEMSRRYQRTKFEAVDNILDMKYFGSFLSNLAASREHGHDIVFFYETKANLKKEHLKQLNDAGVISIQPGIESLSSPILKLMRKGVTALQNIRLLKWASEYDIDVRWNLLWGFPGESPEEYEQMIALMPSLSHLKPPGLTRLKVQRFSPYFDDSKRLGIKVTEPEDPYRYVYPVDAETLYGIAYSFKYEYETDQPMEYRDALRHGTIAWKKGYNKDRSRLSLERGLGFIGIRDRRMNLTSADYTFSGASAAIYLACDAGATLRELIPLYRSFTADQGTPDDLIGFLDKLVHLRLMYREHDTYLALAVAQRPLISNDEAIQAVLNGSFEPAGSHEPALAAAVV